MNLAQEIRKNKVIAILRNVPFEKTLNYAEAIYQGGIRLVEVALNSRDGLRQIELLQSKFEGRLLIGAGTAITKALAHDALATGARFLLTPSVSEEVLDYCAEERIELLPGVMTPTDVTTCLKYGFNTLKLFPAADLPENYCKSLKGPFDKTEYVAVGGVGPDNAKKFFEHGFVGVGIGSSLIPAEYVSQNRWEEAAGRISRFVNALN